MIFKSGDGEKDRERGRCMMGSDVRGSVERRITAFCRSVGTYIRYTSYSVPTPP